MEHMDIDVKLEDPLSQYERPHPKKNGEGTEKREEETTNLDTISCILTAQTEHETRKGRKSDSRHT